MSRRLLLIDDGASGFGKLSACSAALEVLRCDPREWGAASTDGKAHLLVPVAFAAGPLWTESSAI
jgi:hypothetical protein